MAPGRFFILSLRPFPRCVVIARALNGGGQACIVAGQKGEKGKNMTGDREKGGRPSRRHMLAGSAAFSAVMGLDAGLFGRAFAALRLEEGPLVETAQGKLRGLTDGDMAVFRGIRYGASTGGRNRFLPAQKPPSWGGVWEAFQYGPIAPQRNPAGKTDDFANPDDYGTHNPALGESEDCLRLTVTTPKVDRNARLPVMLWLHPGGFSTGSGSIPMAHGRLPKVGNVVAVTINHRLNAFGYCYLGDILGADYTQSGNIGNLDIVAALQWVQENIEGFGGDPGNITIFGVSGGGSKVSCLMAMPAAKGLFHRGIIESGPSLAQGTKEQGTRGAEALLKALGLTRETAGKIHDVSTREILAAYFKTQRNGGYFSPIVDGVALPRDAFTPDASPLCADVPLIIGTTRHETAFFFRANAKPDLDMAGLRRNLSRYKALDAEEAIRIYQGEKPKASPWELWLMISSDFQMRMNSITLAERKAKQKAPVYMYRFEWETKAMGGHMYAPHEIEVPFVFNALDETRWLVGEGPGLQSLADRMSHAWANFAKTGDPNGNGLPHWPAYDEAKRETMIWNLEPEVVSDPSAAARKLVMKAMADAR
jgi:para-nitrobenzyl esterase